MWEYYATHIVYAYPITTFITTLNNCPSVARTTFVFVVNSNRFSSHSTVILPTVILPTTVFLFEIVHLIKKYSIFYQI